MSDDGPTDEERRAHARKWSRSVPVVVVSGTDEPDTQVDPDVVRRLRADVAKLKRQLRIAKVVLALAGPIVGLAGFAFRELRAALIQRIERVENDVREHQHNEGN
jgi:hypothetical protein